MSWDQIPRLSFQYQRLAVTVLYANAHVTPGSATGSAAAQITPPEPPPMASEMLQRSWSIATCAALASNPKKHFPSAKIVLGSQVLMGSRAVFILHRSWSIATLVAVSSRFCQQRPSETIELAEHVAIGQREETLATSYRRRQQNDLAIAMASRKLSRHSRHRTKAP